jgi:hypothetical protein
MEVYCNGTARIQHHSSGRIYEIDGDLLDWEIVGGDDRQMGLELHHEAAVDHPDLGKITWGLEKIGKKDLGLESLMVSERVHIGHALGATVFSPRESRRASKCSAMPWVMR